MDIRCVQAFCIYGIPLPERHGGPTKYDRLLYENSPHLADWEGKYKWEILNMGHQSNYKEMTSYLTLEYVSVRDERALPTLLSMSRMSKRTLSGLEREELKEVCEYFGMPYQTPHWYLAFNTM